MKCRYRWGERRRRRHLEGVRGTILVAPLQPAQANAEAHLEELTASCQVLNRCRRVRGSCGHSRDRKVSATSWLTMSQGFVDSCMLDYVGLQMPWTVRLHRQPFHLKDGRLDKVWCRLSLSLIPWTGVLVLAGAEVTERRGRRKRSTCTAAGGVCPSCLERSATTR